jgi:hypothetical protein
MRKNNWHGIMKVLEIQHLDSNKNIIWQTKNIYNLLHEEGEQFLLQAAFVGGKESTIIPDYYYLGLDNRQTVATTDTLDDVLGEPVSGGYARIELSSSGDFTVSYDQDHYVALSPIVSFSASSGAWGPVVNLFLTASVEGDYKLISTATLPSPIFLNIGQTITMRIGMQIRDGSTSN